MSIIVNGKSITAEKGGSLLDVCLEAGIYIPHLCSHPDLRPIGACGLCKVKIEGEDELVSSCTTEASDGMTVTTESDEITEVRREVMKRILEEHPSDCDSCIKYLNCELQSLKQYINTDGIHGGKRMRNIADNNENPIFNHNPGRCIRCGRCVRACRELRDVGVLYFKKRGEYTYVGIGDEGAGADAKLFDDLTEEQLDFIGSGDDISLAEAGCRFCGACAEVCPTGAILDRHEFEDERNKRDALIPCAGTCPAGIDVPGYLRFVRLGEFDAAVALLRESVTMPLVLGYVCARPCEALCRRGEVNEAVAIRDMKRYAAEKGSPDLWKDNIVKKAASGKRVAVIGAGPAGISAAYRLVLLGHEVVVYEKESLAGGTLRYGIPAYRLPDEALDEEIALLEDVGVRIETDHPVTDVPALLSGEGFDAVLVAIGAGKGSPLKIRGYKGERLLLNTDFLKAVRKGEKPKLGTNVLVLGGGNVAFDCARTARRLGAEKVGMAFLEARDKMTASDDEIQAALEEGVELYPSVNFGRMKTDEEDNLCGLGVQDVSSFYFDENGMLQLELVEDSEHTLECDTIIFAVGQKPDIPEDFGIAKTDRGFVETDTYTQMTSAEGVFAVSDCTRGADSVVRAIADAYACALKIDKYLGGRGRLSEKYAPEIVREPKIGKVDGFAGQGRIADHFPPAEQRLSGFGCAQLPPEDDDAAYESSRCLMCDMRPAMTQVKFWGSY